MVKPVLVATFVFCCSTACCATALTTDDCYPREMPRKKSKGPSFTGYIRIITNVLTFGLSAATTSTVKLATDAAKATADLAVQPFNTLFKATKETYFAPQVAYPDRSWSGIVESLSARKRAWTGESKTLERPRAGSVATFHHLSSSASSRGLGPPPRSTSVPAHLAHPDLSIAIRRQRLPDLRPLDIPGASLQVHRRGPASPLSPEISPLLTPSLCESPSSYASSMPSSPGTPALSASAPSFSHADRAKQAKGKGKFGGLEIARVSFWNLVRLAEEEEAKSGAVAVEEIGPDMLHAGIVVPALNAR